MTVSACFCLSSSHAVKLEQDLPRNEQKPHPLDEVQQLREENLRLKALLTKHGIAWDENLAPVTTIETSIPAPGQLSIADKISVFRRLFRGRIDVYPLRWQSAKGTAGYAPACGNEWKPEFCHKPKIKCGDCFCPLPIG